MRSLKRTVVGLAFIATSAITWGAFADQPHSWCVTGAPLILNGSPDPTTNQIIASVCNQPGTADCCQTGGRWRLECVQRAANYAVVNGAGDVCGRYNKWDNRIGTTDMRIPRDFNLVALSGNVSGIRDVEGSVATAGWFNGYYFRLNNGRQERTAVYAKQGVTLGDGEVFGDVIHEGFISTRRVTFLDGAAVSQPLPVDFGGLQTNLIGMSNALAGYTAVPAFKEWSTLHFIGSDPELNVFSVNANDLLTTYDYHIDVPAGASAIINVFGASPEIKYAGFRGYFSTDKILWNFPNATTLIMRSVGFPGSVLAPSAAADLRDGSLRGTVVVGSAYSNVELYMAPFDMPSAGGCLAFAPEWSCSDDTKVNEYGQALDVDSEAGFIEIPMENYSAEGDARMSPRHRVWYSFHPAKHYPESQPVAVFFNGGPGSATSQYLFSLNTGPKTLDPVRTGSASIANNANANWSEFVNLLYIDAPGTGFSYPLKNPDGTTPDLGTDMDRDAAMYLQVVTRFLRHHPPLVDNNVMIVGESYGGARSVLMYYHLLKYGDLIDPTAYFQDAQLYDDLRWYFMSAFGTYTPTATDLVSRWRHQVLIQPVVAGDEQIDEGDARFPYDASDCRAPSCWGLDPDDHPDQACDMYNCDLPTNWAVANDDEVERRLTTVSTLEAVLGVDPRTIEWMSAAARINAYGRTKSYICSTNEDCGDLGTCSGGICVFPEPDMEAEFGTLGSNDRYFLRRNTNVFSTYPGARSWDSTGAGDFSAAQFAIGLQNGVETFITVARYDSVVPTVGIPAAIGELALTGANLPNFVENHYYSAIDQFFNLPRNGILILNFVGGGSSVPIAMPHYYESGHTVSRRAPDALKADVMQWYLHSLQ